MFKRNGIEFNHDRASKRFKHAKPTTNIETQSSSNETGDEDMWGDDFAQSDIEEMDLLALQATGSQTLNDKGYDGTQGNFVHMPSPMAGPSGIANYIPSQVLGGDRTMFEDFQSKLLRNGGQNSTFRVHDKITVPDDKSLNELEKIKVEKGKLLNSVITKDGEIEFLRQQLNSIQQRTKHITLENTRQLEKQTNQHRSETEDLRKKIEQLKCQIEVQQLEFISTSERYKLLESGLIKFTEPYPANADVTVNKSKSFSNSSSSIIAKRKTVSSKENGIQVDVTDKTCFYCKSQINHPMSSRIPTSMFVLSPVEKSIVDIRIMEKTGQRNLPILQEEKTFRIFENSELVKPIDTLVDNRKLSVETILPELALIERKTNSELDSKECIFAFNKLICTVKELMLNTTSVLRTIFPAMKNDDIEDMNDLYFSNMYDVNILHQHCTCDPMPWNKEERGINVRRIIGVLSFICIESSYVCNYITGKIPLQKNIDKDYLHYEKQMIRYNGWSKKDCEFELLVIFLEFATLIGMVRRAHQFSGLVTAILNLLSNVHKKVGFCEKGLDYVLRIFKEFVFSRPLAFCYTPLIETLMTFIEESTFARKMCTGVKELGLRENLLHFTSNSCILAILILQMDNFKADIITTINITYALTRSARITLLTNRFPWKRDVSLSCNCSLEILKFTIKMLCKCSSFDITKMESHTKDKQLNTFREGIRFLSHLTTCDPDFIIRVPDIEDSFHLFVQNIDRFHELDLHINEREALNQVRTIFVIDKPISSNNQYPQENSHSSLNFKNINLIPKHVDVPRRGQPFSTNDILQNRKNSSSFKYLFKS